MVPELLVRNFQVSLKFYTEILGFTEVHSRENPDFVYLEQEKAQIMLEQLSDDSWLTGNLEYPLGRGVHLQIELSAIQPIYNRICKKEYPIYKKLKENWYPTGECSSGQKEFLVQDPDGYLLRFCQHIGNKSS